MGSTSHSKLACFLAITVSLLAPCSSRLRFKDVTAASGIRQKRPSLKFGGPCVADLDGDGIFDLILSYHNADFLQVYFGSENGTFSLAPFRTIHYDIHGVAVAPQSTNSRSRLLSISVGGGAGSNLKFAEVYTISPERKFEYVTERLGLSKVKGRGRNTVFMDLSMRNRKQMSRSRGAPDVLFTNFLGGNKRLRQFAYRHERGKYSLQKLVGYNMERTGRVGVTDVDGDGMMEVINIQELKIFKLVKAFHFEDVSAAVLPEDLDVGYLTVTSVAELDFDNDGDFDLYVGRATRWMMTRKKALGPSYTDDILLENRGGVYVDVSKEAKIPKRTNSMGVTVGDFNNDGNVDIMVSLYKSRDMILLNKGDGTFSRQNGLIPKGKRRVGNNAVAVDYDNDGRVDLVVGQGNEQRRRGYYLLMRNVMGLTKRRGFLLVRVGHAVSRGATGLHAVVRALVKGKLMVRRVGGCGAQGGGSSFLDWVHFGVRDAKRVKWVEVVWTNGERRRRWNLKVNQKVVFGVI